MINRRCFLKFVYLSSAVAIPILAIGKLYINKVQARVPVLGLINGAIVFLDLVDKALNVGEKIKGAFKIRNDTDSIQSGNIVINIFDFSNPSSPEVRINQNITLSPKSQQTYPLPQLEPSSPGQKILQVTTGSNSLSVSFRYGSFCCDSRGNRRCPVPYSLDLGTECLCSGQGVGNICE